VILIILRILLGLSLFVSNINVSFSNNDIITENHIVKQQSKNILNENVGFPDKNITSYSNQQSTFLNTLSPPDFDVKSYILFDANSGNIIAEKNSHVSVRPASLTKVMTLYLVAQSLQSGRIHLYDKATVSEIAWRTGGSRMFIPLGSIVTIEELIKGIVVASGNDATVTIAEYIAGTESVFVELMNRTAKLLNMNNTYFSDSSGLPNANNYSTAYDLAILTKSWIKNFPEYYPWFKEKWIIYNKIKQPNRNRLLWIDDCVDGMKTGHTDEAGYCLIASSKKNGMRLIAILMGAKNDTVRTNNTKALLDYGFRFFKTNKIFTANQKIIKIKTNSGKNNFTTLGISDDLFITLPVNDIHNLKIKIITDKMLKAPILKYKKCGMLYVIFNNKIIESRPLIALHNNDRANFIFVFFNYLVNLFHKY